MAAARTKSMTWLPAVVPPGVNDDLTVDVIDFDDALTHISRMVALHPRSGAGP